MRTHGFTLVEMLVVVVLIGLSTVGLTAWYERDAQRTLEASEAEHVRIVGEAAAAWAKDNYATIVGGTSPGGTVGYQLTLDTLKSGGYLPPSFLARSPLGGTYAVRFRQPSAGSISGLVLVSPASSDARPEDLQLRRIARQVGAAGGYIEAVRPSGTSASQIDGALGAWTINAADWGWSAPSAGSLAYSLFFSQAESTGDFLYRRGVPGRPELNRMDVELNLNGNAITNVSQISATRVSGNVVLPASSATVGSACSGTESSLVRGGTTGLMFCDGARWRAVTLSN